MMTLKNVIEMTERTKKSCKEMKAFKGDEIAMQILNSEKPYAVVSVDGKKRIVGITLSHKKRGVCLTYIAR